MVKIQHLYEVEDIVLVLVYGKIYMEAKKSVDLSLSILQCEITMN